MSDPILHIRGLRFKYPGSGGWVVDVADLSLQPGEQVLLTGGSGRGKSTLLHLIAGLIEPPAGTGASVSVAGVDMLGLRGAARDLHRGRTIGMVFQSFHLLHGFTAIENVMAAMMFGSVPRREHAGRASALLDRLGIERHHAHPEELSVGQQQRVAVARALACDPPLVLADEPTASLDPEHAGGAMDLMQEVCRERGAALLCVSHDPAMRERFARRLGMDELSGEARVAGA